jgi:methylated-DNA-[protein]-cysteine S-methyltransferase
MTLHIKAEIGTTAVDTAKGWMGIAWSARGLASVTLPQPTRAMVLSQIPPASDPVPLAPAGLDVTALADKLRRYFCGEAVILDELLDPTIGTPFQRRVWAITRAIPRGQTRTYGEIAREAGSPGAARAVGQAMARNPWPVIVPCHRVVGGDRRLVGFGGGLEMKRELLIMEGAITNLTPSDKDGMIA